MATGAIVGAIVAAVGAAATTTATVVTNKKAREENRRLQAEMNEYNTQQTDPAYIRQRQEDAGYNAQLLANPSSLGQVGTQNSFAPAQVPQMPDYGQNLSSMIGLATQYMQSESEKKLKDAQTEQIHIENKYRAAQAVANLRKTLEETNDVVVKRQLNQILSRYQEQMYQADLNLSAEQINNMRENTKGQVIENMMSSVNLKFLPTMLRLDVANSAAELAIRKQTEKLSQKQVEHEAYKIAETIARTQTQDQQTELTTRQAQAVGQQVRMTEDTYSEQIRRIQAEVLRAVNNVGSDNPLQLGQQMVNRARDWWMSRNPFD